jgi:S1-C subfamily serine protease
MGHLIGLQSLAMADNRWLGLSIPIHILRERMPELAALPLAPRSDLTGDLARRFPEHSLAQRLADRIDPAVVALAVRHSGQERPPARFPATADERDPVPADPRARARAERVPSAEGFSSGVIISANGLVLTAMGPLGDIDDIAALRVYDHTGTGWRADLLGYSELDDIALLKISAGVERFPFLELSADAEPRSGRAVVLAGRSQPPGGLSLNLGRISAVERFEERAWQMDAAVNYGNAGGAVLDLDGRLLGIAAWLEPNTPWRQNAGVGFVARSDRLAEILPRLENGEEIERKPRPFIGFRPAPFDGTGPGVLVAGVVPASPAASAGLEAGDRIVGLGGEAITGWQHLLEVLDTFEPGQQVGLSVDRDNERIDMELILGTRGGL